MRRLGGEREEKRGIVLNQGHFLKGGELESEQKKKGVNEEMRNPTMERGGSGT